MNAALSAEINRLTPAEKLRLIEELWDTLAQNPENLPIPPEHARALAEDEAAYRADPAAGVPWVAGALLLPPEQRQQLAKLLLDSLEPNGPSGDELKLMLRSRLDALRSGQDRGLSLDKVFRGSA